MAAAADGQSVFLFGIRHHGPGSARSLLRALEDLSPDVILVEGPSDAAEAIARVGDPELVPPVALLSYDPAEPSRCAFHPFAEFSPEWQALLFARTRSIPARMMDLPAMHMLALGDPAEAAGAEESGRVPVDPMLWMAKAAEYDDAERWWDAMVERRRGGGDIFAAIAEIMTELRGEFPAEPGSPGEKLESIREAWMRQAIRAAQKEGFTRIAVVCGAWHVPALARMPAAREDAVRLKGLPKAKVESTWAPWSYPRLAASSGYRAGIPSPGWYEHLWRASGQAGTGGRLAVHWLAQAASVLRAEDFDVSPAHLIEAVRLVDALCAMREVSDPGLGEIEEAIVSVLLFGDAVPLALLRRRLVIGTAIGEVPQGIPRVPLQADFERTAKSLRLKLAADFKDIVLDLREPTDLARSILFHRLRLLRVPWGRLGDSTSRGTFRESWRIEWAPEMTIRLIEASRWGSTVESAAVAFVVDAGAQAATVAAVAELIADGLLADLGDTIPPLVARLGSLAATGSDAGELMDAFPALARTSRYGSVRGTDLTALTHVIDATVARICIGLPAVCASLDDDAAVVCVRRIRTTEDALVLLERADMGGWHDALRGLDGRSDLHGLVGGCASRLLFDAGQVDADEVSRRLGLALSRAASPLNAGHWLEGFLAGSSLLLIHNPALWGIVDGWVSSLTHEAFRDVLPVLRRTFSSFSAPERRQVGELVRRGEGPAPHGMTLDSGIEVGRASLVIPTLALILGTEVAAT